MTVTGHHAKLGTRLLARLYRDRHLRRLDFMRLQGATLPKLDMSRFDLIQLSSASSSHAIPNDPDGCPDGTVCR